MPNHGYVPKNGPLPSDAVIHTRGATNRKIEVPDREQISMEHVAAGVVAMKKVLSDLARQIENRSRLVDEYQTEGTTAANETSVSVQPTWDLVPEKIESVIVVGPPGNITLQIGDRVWPLTIPASGILVIAPVALLVGRNDARTVTGPAGNYFLELMGVADVRFDA